MIVTLSLKDGLVRKVVKAQTLVNLKKNQNFLKKNYRIRFSINKFYRNSTGVLMEKK